MIKVITTPRQILNYLFFKLAGIPKESELIAQFSFPDLTFPFGLVCTSDFPSFGGIGSIVVVVIRFYFRFALFLPNGGSSLESVPQSLSDPG